MMRKFISTLIFLLFPLISYPQYEKNIFEDAGTPKVYYDALGFSSIYEGDSRLDVFIQIPYEALFFIKQGNVYLSTYELSVNIYDAKNILTREKLWTESIKTNSYEETISPKPYKLSQQSFLLTPGKYSVAVQLRDNETKKSVRSTRTIELRDFSQKPFDCSDIMILNQLSVDGETKTIIPNITGNVAELEGGFFTFMELYNNNSIDSISIMYNINSGKEKILKQDTAYYILKEGKNAIFVKVNTDNIPMGNYNLEYSIRPNELKLSEEEINKNTISVAKSFIIKWRGMPISIVDLDIAIDQMIYIFEPGEIEKIKKLPPNEKGIAFKELWNRKDPTPGTERNELMEEYYARVEYANKTFKHYIEGWRTDMGMVYIIFGPPNNIDRHPFELNAKPYEVWHYHELNRQFIFVDQSGFGDYQLVTPIWDVWQRPR